MASDNHHVIDDHNDRRGRARTDVKLDVNYRHGDVYLYSRSSNASEFGIFLLSDEPRPVGSLLELEFKTPHARQPIKVTGKVVWVEENKGGAETGMGVQFVDLDSETQQRIRSLIRIVACID
jgi:uncharacterized protein (TIGR02266 family)